MIMPFKLEKRPADSRLMSLMSPVLAIVLTLITGGILFASLGQDPFFALSTFFLSPLQDMYGWTELGTKVAPILLCAMGLMLCFKAKIWNIGAEGQFILGGLGGGYLALELIEAEGAWGITRGINLWCAIRYGCLGSISCIIKNPLQCQRNFNHHYAELHCIELVIVRRAWAFERPGRF